MNGEKADPIKMRMRTVLCMCILMSGTVNLAEAATVCPSASSRPPVTDYWRTTFDLEDGELRSGNMNGGNGYADRSDSASLAWAESYLLNGYLTMYRAYRDTWYLDKLVCHFDQMIENLADPEGDGYLGWSTTDYSAEKVLNGQFTESDPSDGTLPLNWRRWQSIAQTAHLEGPGSETYLVVETDENRGWQIVEQSIASYVPKRMYTVRFRGKIAGVSGVRGRVEIYDATIGAVLATRLFSDSSWENEQGRQSLSFRAPEAGHELKITCYHESVRPSGEKAYFDDFSVKLAEEYLVHDGVILQPIAGFIKTVKQDPELAEYLAKANQYLQLIENNFIKKWQAESYNTYSGIYEIRTDEAPAEPYFLATTSLPHNQYLPWAALLSEVGAVTDNASYKDRTSRLVQTFKGHLVQLWFGERTMYLWNYADRIVAADGLRPIAYEDTSHGGVDIRSVMAIANNTEDFNFHDLQQFSETLLTIMWQPYFKTFSRDVGGSFAPNDPVHGDHNFGWIDLAEVNLEVRDAVRQSYQKVENNGFEIPDIADSSLPDGWQRWQASSQTAIRSTSEQARRFGDGGLMIKTNPAAGWQALVQKLNLEISTDSKNPEYKVAFWGKTNGVSGFGGRVDVYDETAQRVLGSITFSNSSWQRHSFTFFPPKTPTDEPHEINIYLYQSDYRIVDGVVYFDDVTVRINEMHFFETLAKLAEWDTEQVVNRSFELSDALDTSLPANWSRWQSTELTAYRSVEPGESLSGRAGLVVKTDPTVGWQIVEQAIQYTPGERYTVNFFGRTNNAVDGRMSVFDETTGQLLGDKLFSQTAWAPYDFSFVAPSGPGHVLKLYCYHRDWNVVGGTTSFDEVKVRIIE